MCQSGSHVAIPFGGALNDGVSHSHSHDVISYAAPQSLCYEEEILKVVVIVVVVAATIKHGLAYLKNML